MAIETRVAQKEKLYGLLYVKKEYEKAGLQVLDALLQTIHFAKAAMEAEDIAHVEKQVAEQE